MKKGFTLIELVVVVAIIAILTTIIIVAVENTQKNARDAKRISHLKDMQKMLLAYQSANGHLPNDSEYENDLGGWDYGCSDETNPVCNGGFLDVLVNEGITKFTYKETMDIKDTWIAGGPGGYRYMYTSDDCDNDGNNETFGILYTPCESKKCPIGEAINSCPNYIRAGSSLNDETSYIIFMFEE